MVEANQKLCQYLLMNVKANKERVGKSLLNLRRNEKMSWEKDADAIWAKTRSYREGYYYVQLARAYSPQPLYYSVSVETYGEKFRSRAEAEKYYDKIRISNRACDGDVVGKKLYYLGEHDTLEVLKVDKTRDRRYCQHVENHL